MNVCVQHKVTEGAGESQRALQHNMSRLSGGGGRGVLVFIHLSIFYLTVWTCSLYFCSLIQMRFISSNQECDKAITSYQKMALNEFETSDTHRCNMVIIKSADQQHDAPQGHNSGP